MGNWAILSGIMGNLAAYEAVLADLKRQRQSLQELYILGDVIAATPESAQLIQRIQSPRYQEPVPHVCQGWWEEQLLILHGLGHTGEPTELIEQYGITMTKMLWDAIPRAAVEWVRSLEFGFFELDCLLIHGSSLSVSETLTPATPAIQMLDRLARLDANNLFCGRSGTTFQYSIQQGSVNSQITTLDQVATPQTVHVYPRQVIGVGSVGKVPGQATYTLYNPNSGHIEFKTVKYASGKGFKSR
jgi:hypothetical protein